MDQCILNSPVDIDRKTVIIGWSGQDMLNRQERAWVYYVNKRADRVRRERIVWERWWTALVVFWMLIAAFRALP